MINVKEFSNNQLASEYIKETEYLRENGTLKQLDYERKIKYVNELRKELFNRDINDYREMKRLAEK